MHTTRAAFAGVVSAALVVALPTNVCANGRFPGAGQVVVDPTDPSHLVLRSTFGLLDTRDGGKTMRWVCEEAAFFAQATYDPPIAVGRGGVVIAGLANGLSLGTAGGCTWEKSGPPLEGHYVVDVSFDSGGRGLAVTTDATGRGLFASSDDAGATWRTTLLPEDVDPLTVDAAPGRRARVYVSGRFPFAQFGGLLRSDDGGATWTTTTFDLRQGRAAYIAAVDPNNPDRLWIRVSGDTDRLLVSIDAGATFREVLAAGGPLYGFALSPDGLRLAVSTPVDGLLIASATDHAFAKVAPVDARCLAWSTEGLYVCASEPANPYSLGFLRDGRGTIEPRYRLRDTTPLSCPTATRTGATCPALWPAVATRLGADGPASSGPRDAGEAGSTSDAGRLEAPPSAGTEPTGCSHASSRHAPWLGSVMIGGMGGIVAAALIRRRRRRDDQ